MKPENSIFEINILINLKTICKPDTVNPTKSI